MTMDLENLRVFLAAAEHGSFGRAASALGLAQPSVSNRIALFERDIGRPLFTRSTRGIVLTPAGQRLVPHARRALQVVEDAQRAVQTTSYQPPVRVLLSASYAPVLLPAVVGAFEATDSPLAISYDHGPNVVRAIDTGEADLGFLAPCPHPVSVVLRPLGASPIVAVVAPDHPLARHRRPLLADLSRHPVAVYSWGDGVETFLEELPGDVRLCRISPVPAAAQLARDGGYVTLAPRAALVSDLRSRSLVQLPVADLPSASISLALATHRSTSLPIAGLITRVRRALQAPSTNTSR
jgi:LysR family transcriptional regulator, putative pyruvate carboxylase regulator